MKKINCANFIKSNRFYKIDISPLLTTQGFICANLLVRQQNNYY
ncbi:hypothetical protein PPRY_b0202 [Pseudoalteromonas prydzensis ACAM 620]|nr:hypothetical protein [Pseudoalteromonas prydzensis ACAM 620]